MAAHSALPLVLAAVIRAALGDASVSRGDRDQFDICYGSFEGAEIVLPQLRSQFNPAYYREISEAMEDLGANLVDLEAHFADHGLTKDQVARNGGHLAGRLPWLKPENRTLDFWAQNGPMSQACFELIKRLNAAFVP